MNECRYCTNTLIPREIFVGYDQPTIKGRIEYYDDTPCLLLTTTAWLTRDNQIDFTYDLNKKYKMGYGTNSYIRIKYCPECGRKLSPETLRKHTIISKDGNKND